MTASNLDLRLHLTYRLGDAPVPQGAALVDRVPGTLQQSSTDSP
jgi:hypothetical protein